jgi:flagellin
LGITGMGMDKTIERLTTGLRINRSADDAAGLAITNALGADIRITAQGRRNAYDGIAYLAIADGVLEEVNTLLTRALELTEQARTGTINDTNRKALNLEFQNIIKGVCDIGNRTRFNAKSIFTRESIGVSVADFTMVSLKTGTFSNYGADCRPGHEKDIEIFRDITAQKADGTWINGPIVWMGEDSTIPGGNSILSVSAADDVRPLLYAGIQYISMMRASIGANQQQLNSVANTLGIEVENFTGAYSQIRDANIADEMISLTKFQILNQSGTNALAQANQAAQSVLQILR